MDRLLQKWPERRVSLGLGYLAIARRCGSSLGILVNPKPIGTRRSQTPCDGINRPAHAFFEPFSDPVTWTSV